MPGSKTMPERQFLRGLALALCVLLAAALCACGSDEEKGAEKGAQKAAESAAPAAPAVTKAAPEPEAAPVTELTAEERARAEAALDFHNTAMNALETGYYALPEALYANARLYLKTWQLPGRPKGAGSREAAKARLKPKAGVFSEEEAAKLTAALAGMDKALDSLLGKYKALEDYVADSRIKDDGAKGKALAAKLDADHAEFMAARKSWLEIVEARAAQAEAALLRGHPLQRQIEAASAIFAGFGRAAELLGAEDAAAAGEVAAKGAAAEKQAGDAAATLEATARTTLQHIHTELANRIAEAGKPPFAAAPQLERQYRAFLKEAQAYADALGRGLAEGFYPPQRRELNVAALRSRAAYNAFVREANGLRAR
ncbi:MULTISPECIES: hypothetical protein [unclassified Desulfovibrio]|uniref:hypothetical protein n=1 Tax=unclassified Desulfovibrio TaxID=2593640 RepID=UPI001F14E088|nr:MULTISPECIES: hypothetical protein [unclassified Desulfovibrio]